MKSMHRWIIGVCFFLLFMPLMGQSIKKKGTYVDEKGLIRWNKDKSEVFGFGVNYSTPFAHAYRMAERMGVDHKEAIQQDVYHMARLGLDLYRVHIWDTEITDTLGNLLHNEHLNLFDFAIAEMKKREINFVITPIAYWGNGWPEPDFETPGFSFKYGKEACLVNPDAIKAQENYLAQFMNHVNPYTGIAYKDEPNLLVVEVCNEPHHKGTVEEVTEFINRMVASIRSTGATVPVFYNMSHSIHLAEAYLQSDAQGGTFQWYPAGLVSGYALNGNFLPHVASYDIPFASDQRFMNKGKIVYEFDPADVAGNYMYPAMAQSFRKAGMQLATQFDYDAMFLAPFNTNYGTHYMSLPYAPQKALSLKIASALFHHQPVYGDSDKYLNISYDKDLVEYISPSVYYHSNSTESEPSNIKSLKEIAGWGNSPLVKYDGTGAYFLDEVEKGVWRLEVMPDAYWVEDPYGPTAPNHQVAAVHHTERNMEVTLPVLGKDFMVHGINSGNEYKFQADEKMFSITPGVYLLHSSKTKTKLNAETVYKNIRLGEFIAPKSDLKKLVVSDLTFSEFSTHHPISIKFEIMSPQNPLEVEVQMTNSSGGASSEMAKNTHQNIYEVLVPENLMKPGEIKYNIMVKVGEEWHTFPSGVMGRTSDWSMYDRSSYSIKLFTSKSPIILWNAASDWERTFQSWHPGVNLEPTFVPNEDRLFMDFDVTARYHEEISDMYTLKFYFKERIGARIDHLTLKNKMVIEGNSIGGEDVLIEVALQDKSGNVQSAELYLNSIDTLYSLSLSDFSEGKFAIIPRPFPEFLPYYSSYQSLKTFDWQTVETVQLTVKSANVKDSLEGVKLSLKKIWLE